MDKTQQIEALKREFEMFDELGPLSAMRRVVEGNSFLFSVGDGKIISCLEDFHDDILNLISRRIDELEAEIEYEQ